MKTTRQLTSNILFLILILAITSGMAFSQGGGPKKGGAKREQRQDKIKQLKIAYLTEELELTSTEAEKFWPIYNEMEEKMKNLRKENKKVMDDLRTNGESYSDEDYKKCSEKIFNGQQAELNLKKEYFGKFATVLGYKKAMKLMRAEKEFKAKLLKELKQQQGGGPNKQPK